MIEGVTARGALTKDMIDAVVRRTDGVPLFAEELTRLILEGDGHSAWREIPATLHDSLTARLDRLGSAKEVAQVAAVLGREFSYELLHAVSPMEEDELQSALAKLSDAELIYARGIPPEATYQFKHALILDAAYEALLKSRRKELHRRVAQTIAEKFPASAEAEPEILARHWTAAGEAALAIDAWQRSSDRAIERDAFLEAEAHLRQGLALLEGIVETAERDRHELSLQLALGRVMSATRGWAVAETEEVYSRALTLAEQSDVTESIHALAGLCLATAARGDMHVALISSERLLEIAQRMDRPSALVAAHYTHGLAHISSGNLAEARQQFRQAIDQYQEADTDFPAPGLVWGHAAHVLIGINEWLLGYPEQALRCVEDEGALARRLNNPVASAFGYAFGALFDSIRGDFARARIASEEGERLSAESGFPLLAAASKTYGAGARAHLGEVDGAVAAIQQGLAELHAFKFHWGRSVHLSILSETQALAGAIDDALVTVERALESNPDELWGRPLTLRLRGELRLQSKAHGAQVLELAERDFRDAIELSRKMSAKSPELRATISLAQLLRDTNRDEARDMLAEIYNWFTEGFDTADLKDAKALLDAL
jgi:hypothetical protein